MYIAECVYIPIFGFKYVNLGLASDFSLWRYIPLIWTCQ